MSSTRHNFLKLLAAGLFFLTTSNSLAISGPQQWSIGYWAVTDAPISDMEWGALTHVAQVVALANADGTLDLTRYNLSTTAPALISAAHAKGVKVLLEICPRGQYDGTPDTMAQTLTNKRTTLVNNIMNTVNAYGYDGVNIDWEPSGHLVDATNAALLRSFLEELRAKLGTKLLTAAAIASDYPFWSTVHSLLDNIGVMTYDMGHYFDFSWHNSALYDAGETWFSTNSMVQRWVNAGIPAKKMAIGIPFYGWLWQGGGITGPRQKLTSTKPTQKQLEYKNMASMITKENYRWDSSAHVPYLSIETGNDSTDQFLTYDNEQSIKEKVNYAINKNLGGWIIWNIGGDYFPSRVPKHPLLAAIKEVYKKPSSLPLP